MPAWDTLFITDGALHGFFTFTLLFRPHDWVPLSLTKEVKGFLKSKSIFTFALAFICLYVNGQDDFGQEKMTVSMMMSIYHITMLGVFFIRFATKQSFIGFAYGNDKFMFIFHLSFGGSFIGYILSNDIDRVTIMWIVASCVLMIGFQIIIARDDQPYCYTYLESSPTELTTISTTTTEEKTPVDAAADQRRTIPKLVVLEPHMVLKMQAGSQRVNGVVSDPGKQGDLDTWPDAERKQSIVSDPGLRRSSEPDAQKEVKVGIPGHLPGHISLQDEESPRSIGSTSGMLQSPRLSIVVHQHSPRSSNTDSQLSQLSQISQFSNTSPVYYYAPAMFSQTRKSPKSSKNMRKHIFQSPKQKRSSLHVSGPLLQLSPANLFAASTTRKVIHITGPIPQSCGESTTPAMDTPTPIDDVHSLGMPLFPVSEKRRHEKQAALTPQEDIPGSP